MDHTTQVSLIKRLFDYADHKTTGMVETESFNDVNDYSDPEQFRTEQRILFRNYPIIVGFSSQVKNPGDFITHDDTGVPILVVRDRGGKLRAFINVCRHRNAVLVTEPKGCDKKSFVCPYHAWSYDTQGNLLAMPQDFGFAGLDRGHYSLRALPVVERHGMIWVRPSLSESPDLDVDSYLGPWGKDFEAFGFGGFVYYDTAVIRRKMNWKLMVDTFLEFYHFRWAHNGSIYPLFLDNVTSFDAHGPHVRLVSGKRTLLELKGKPEKDWNLIDHSLCLYEIFPNSVVSMQGDHGSLFSMFPVNNRVDESVLYISLLIPELPKTQSAKEHWDTNLKLLCSAIFEDFAIGESIQRSISSGANTHTTYGRIEPGLDVYHRHINEAIGKKGTRPTG